MIHSISDNASLILTLVALAIGLAAALAGWLLSQALANVPQEDREYKDPPPLGFRLLWLPIQWISHHIAPIVPDRVHASLLIRLRQAGLDFQISPVQFVAARIVSAVLFALRTSATCAYASTCRRSGAPRP